MDNMRARYVNISITEELAKDIDKFIESGEGGYRSRAELISEATRLRIGIAKLKKKSEIKK